jgi:hypothetical protein
MRNLVEHDVPDLTVQTIRIPRWSWPGLEAPFLQADEAAAVRGLGDRGDLARRARRCRLRA